MFTIDEIRPILDKPEFRADFDWVQQSLVLHRLKKGSQCEPEMLKRLRYFAECVLASAPSWDQKEGRVVCRSAAEITEILSYWKDFTPDDRRKLRLRSSLLYEFAELPALASAILQNGDVTGLLPDLLRRKGIFSTLGANGNLQNLRTSPDLPNATFLDRSLSRDALGLAEYQQGYSDAPKSLLSDALFEVAKHLSVGMSATEIHAFGFLIGKRRDFATRSNVDTKLFDDLIMMRFPAELWSSQIEALSAGLTNPDYDSWGFAAPTGTGKTFLARLLIAKTLADIPESKVLYVVPTKALVYEVGSKLSMAFEPFNYQVVEVTPQLVALDTEEDNRLANCSIAVLTPEKADLLLRLGSSFVRNVSLVIIDEAHHIESGTRGTLLELYLWRIRRLLGKRTRVIFLSAVTPNIVDLAKSMGTRATGVLVTQRSTRMRSGVYRILKTDAQKQGTIEYSDGTSVVVVESHVASSQERQLIQLTEQLGVAGPVLIVAKGKGTCEKLAGLMREWLGERQALGELTDREKGSEIAQRLDSRLEREMHPEVPMRSLFNNRIVYHHAGLPPRVRVVVEDAIRANLVDYVFATTTLAEGVNFPFSSVVVQSLALREPPEKGKPTRYHVVTPRSFWNIAGRAGRPGADTEGQVILFEPSLGLEKVRAVLGAYLNPALSSLEPVHSSLAIGLREIIDGLEHNEIKIESLTGAVLPGGLGKSIKGTVNLLRVGLVHARAAGLLRSPEEILEGTFALQQLTKAERSSAERIISSQYKVVEDFLASASALPIEVVAELGLSIETLSDLHDYVLGLSNWQLERMSKVMYGGSVNLDEVKYVVGPVAKRMAELDGTRLGAFYTQVITQWLSGIPMTRVLASSGYRKSLEDLISIIYSRIQFLLPWGLYAMHRLVEREAKARGITYSGEILSMAYLVDAGVPNFDALRLVGLNFERVDASRLADAFHRRRPQDTDVVGWLVNLPSGLLHMYLRGSDDRRLDFDLDRLLKALSGNGNPALSA